MKLKDYIKTKPNQTVKVQQTIMPVIITRNTGITIYYGLLKNLPLNLYNFEIKEIKQDYFINLEYIYI